MTSDTTPPAPRDPSGRAARLREALRENLKRRKTQARGRAGAEPEPAGRDADHPDDPSGDDTSSSS